jgi:hypothetical protein
LDGLQFEVLGKVAGAGNSTSIQQYQFVDAAPVAGDNFYRLRQVDFDGGEAYSKVVYVRMGGKASVKLSPVPVSDRLLVAVQGTPVAESVWFVFDLLGNLIVSGSLDEGQDSCEIAMQALPAGVYLFQLINGQEKDALMFVRE